MGQQIGFHMHLTCLFRGYGTEKACMAQQLGAKPASSKQCHKNLGRARSALRSAGLRPVQLPQ